MAPPVLGWVCSRLITNSMTTINKAADRTAPLNSSMNWVSGKKRSNLLKPAPRLWPPNRPMMKAKVKYTTFNNGARFWLVKINRLAPTNAPMAKPSEKCTMPMVMMTWLMTVDS